VKPEPLKGKLRDIGMGIFSYGDVKSAIEWLKIIEKLMTEAVLADGITLEEWAYWNEYLKFEEAFEDVMQG